MLSFFHLPQMEIQINQILPSQHLGVKLDTGQRVLMLRLCNDLIKWSDLDQGHIWSSADKGLTSTGLRWVRQAEENICGSGEQQWQFHSSPPLPG